MPPKTSLKSFLATAKAALTASSGRQPGPLTLVVGNESADLDSLCSAIYLAYMRTYIHPEDIHIPLSNLPRADLSLRPEMGAVLRHADLSFSDLVTLSELPDLKPQDTRWLLVDHNALTGQLKGFSERVIGCVDHHEDEEAVAQDAKLRVIEPCGSCMSLVVEETKGAWEALADADDDTAAEIDRLAKLALAPILIDTSNLKSKDKVKDKDISAITFLVDKIHGSSFNRTALFDDFTAFKEDLSELSFRDIFRKDYKQWEQGDLKLGVSCIVKNFEYLLDRAGSKAAFLDELEKWAAERDLDIAAVMTTSHPEGQFQRQLMVWGMNDQGVAVLRKFVDVSGPLGLEQWKGGELDLDTTRFAWDQRELAASRKKVAPLLREAMQSG